MKKILCVLLMLATLLCFASCGGNNNEPFVYAQNADGSLTVTAYKAQNKATVTIPDSYLDHKVTAIGAMAFEGTVMMTTVVIPEGVVSIGTSGFANCPRLAQLQLPSTLTEMGDWAFQNCKLLTSVVIPDGVTDVGNHAFKGCVGLNSLTLPTGLKNVGTEAFSELTALTSYTGPLKYLSEVPRGKLTSVTILSGKYDKIEFNTFYGCDLLTEMTYTGTVSEWMEMDKADGWLTSFKQKALVVHCSDGEYTET